MKQENVKLDIVNKLNKVYKCNKCHNSNNAKNNYNVYNVHNRNVPMREGSQNVDVCCRLSRCSLAKQLVPTQKYIGNANQLL